jgi:hypothetical protein
MIFDDYDEVFKNHKVEFFDYVFSYLKEEDISYIVVTHKYFDKVYNTLKN